MPRYLAPDLTVRRATCDAIAGMRLSAQAPSARLAACATSHSGYLRCQQRLSQPRHFPLLSAKAERRPSMRQQQPSTGVTLQDGKRLRKRLLHPSDAEIPTPGSPPTVPLCGPEPSRATPGEEFRRRQLARVMRYGPDHRNSTRPPSRRSRQRNCSPADAGPAAFGSKGPEGPPCVRAKCLHSGRIRRAATLGL
jgi:hypothetical protein